MENVALAVRIRNPIKGKKRRKRLRDNKEKVPWLHTQPFSVTECTVCELCTTPDVSSPWVMTQFVTRGLCPHKSLSRSQIEAKGSNRRAGCRRSD